jgi:hypothetical protein
MQVFHMEFNEPSLRSEIVEPLPYEQRAANRRRLVNENVAGRQFCVYS